MFFYFLMGHFLFKKENYPIFDFRLILVFNKKEPQNWEKVTNQWIALFIFMT